MHYPLQTTHTSITTLVLLLLEGEILKRTQLFDSVAGIVDDSGRTIADQMVDQVQSLEYEQEKKNPHLEDLLPVLRLDSQSLPDRIRDHSVIVPSDKLVGNTRLRVVGSLSDIVQHRSRSTPVLVRKRLVQSLLEFCFLTTR